MRGLIWDSFLAYAHKVQQLRHKKRERTLGWVIFGTWIGQRALRSTVTLKWHYTWYLDRAKSFEVDGYIRMTFSRYRMIRYRTVKSRTVGASDWKISGESSQTGIPPSFWTNTSGRENFWAGIKWVKGEHALTCPSVSLFSFKERHRNTINALFYTQRNKNCGIKDLLIFTYGNYENVWVRGQREKRDCLCIVPLLFPIKNKFEYALKLQIKVLWFLFA